MSANDPNPEVCRCASPLANGGNHECSDTTVYVTTSKSTCQKPQPPVPSLLAGGMRRGPRCYRHSQAARFQHEGLIAGAYKPYQIVGLVLEFAWRIAFHIIRRVGNRPLSLLAGVMLVTTAISM